MTDEEEEEVDESDKHIEARDRRYSCLICMYYSLLTIMIESNFKLAEKNEE